MFELLHASIHGFNLHGPTIIQVKGSHGQCLDTLTIDACIAQQANYMYIAENHQMYN